MRSTWFPLLVMSAALAACGKQAPPPAPPPEVGVVAVKPANVPLQKDLVGRLAAYRSADVRARVPGVLQRRAYAEGSDVRKGQLLFVIDPAPLRAALSQAQASYTNAKVAADRARQLAPTNFISKSDLDNALAAERSAAAAVQAGKASVDSARINLGYASVVSPIDGRAGKQQVTEGARVGQGDATLLTTVDQIDPLYVNFSLSVAELEQVRAAQRGHAQGKTRVQILLPDGTPYERMGELDFSGDVVDPATGAIALRAQLPNPDKILLPGTYVTLNATLGEQQNVFLVPQAAVQRDATSAYVLVVGQDGKVVRKDIVTERAQGNDWVVQRGLASGDQVIVSGLQKAQAGQPAKATPWQPDNGAAPAGGAKKEDKPAAKG